MTSRTLVEAVILKNQWQASVNRNSYPLFLNRHKIQTYVPSSKCGYRIVTNVRDFCKGRRIDERGRSHDENLSSSTSLVNKNMHETSQEADHQTISDASKTKGKVGQTSNLVFGSTAINGSTGELLTLDQKVNTYPSVRRFTAIGIGGDDFVKSMVRAVESVTQHPVPQDFVKQRVSSGGKYVWVNIGPVHVVSREQVQAVYSAMRSDDQMKFFL